jgi:hypothetical protein
MIDFDDPNLDIALSIQQQLGQADAATIDAVMAAMQRRQATDEAKRTMQAAYLNGFIQEASKLVAMKIKDAMDMGPDGRRATLKVVDRISEQVRQAADQLEALGNG